MAGHLMTLLDAVLSDADRRVSELPMLTAAELAPARPLRDPLDARPECVHRHIERQAAATPDAVAVLCGPHRLSYADLDRRANALAHRLRGRGVRAETPVAVCLPRSPDLIVAFLAVLKAGGAYVPADPAYPAERLAYMITDSGARHAITTTELAAVLPAVVTEPVLVDGPPDGPVTADRPPDVETDPGQLAYIVYTSGSTGRPKGAMNTHRGVAGFALAMSRALGLDGTDRALQLAPLSFDVVAEEVYPYLFTGGSVALPDGAAPLGTSELWSLVEATGATSLSTTPSRLLSWGERERAAIPAGLRRLIFGSEAAPALRSLLPWKSWPGDLLQVYGVTEASCTSSVRPVDFTADPDLIAGLGEALPSAELYVLDKWLNPTPAGVPGELYIGGATVGRGYVGRPGLTAERFVPDPYGSPGERLYQTGDIVRQPSSGGYQFIGRADAQVKIRGIRIEPAEVEAALGQQPDVAGCAVVARPDPQGSLRLIGYVVPRAGTAPSTGELRAFLGERLPEWMVPAVFISLPELPVGANGKIDRAALPGPDSSSGDEEEHYVAPQTPVEHELARIWGELLGQDRVGVKSNFFYLGGNSLAAVRMIAEIREHLGVELPMRTLFGIEPTIAVLGEQIFQLLLADEDVT
jgi:amino acid adenylation domain-containing protein